MYNTLLFYKFIFYLLFEKMKIQTAFRFDEELLDLLKEKAKANKRSLNNYIEFVMVDEEFFANADVLSTAAVFALGTPVTSVTNLENGDVLIYKVTREVEDADGNTESFTNYGVIRIGNVTVVNGDAVNFDIDYSGGR